MDKDTIEKGISKFLVTWKNINNSKVKDIEAYHKGNMSLKKLKKNALASLRAEERIIRLAIKKNKLFLNDLYKINKETKGNLEAVGILINAFGEEDKVISEGYIGLQKELFETLNEDNFEHNMNLYLINQESILKTFHKKAGIVVSVKNVKKAINSWKSTKFLDKAIPSTATAGTGLIGAGIATFDGMNDVNISGTAGIALTITAATMFYIKQTEYKKAIVEETAKSLREIAGKHKKDTKKSVLGKFRRWLRS